MKNEYTLLFDKNDYGFVMRIKNPELRELYLRDPNVFYDVIQEALDEALGSIYVSDENYRVFSGKSDEGDIERLICPLRFLGN